MDLNQVRRLAGLPEQALAIAAPVIKEETLPEATVIRDEKQLNEESKKSVIDRIFGEVMSSLGRTAPNMSAMAKKAIKDAISDAYEEGETAGYQDGSQS